MSPLGKITLALIGLRFAGLNGLLTGLFLGHMLIDKTFAIRQIEKWLGQIDDFIRIKLPYKYYKYYNRLDGNIWGKIWGIILGPILFGFWGFLILFIGGQILFDMPENTKIRKFKKKIDHFFDNHWGKIFGFIIGVILKSPILVFVGVILGFWADYSRLEGAKLMPFELWAKYFQKINPLKLWRNYEFGEHYKYLKTMAALAGIVAESDGKITKYENKVFEQIFAIKLSDKSEIAELFNDKKKRKYNVEKYAADLQILTIRNQILKQVSMENLFKIAAADALVKPNELKMLKNIAKIINLDEKEFARLKLVFMPKPINVKIKKFYDVLGIEYEANLNEIKERWKKLIMIYHPDKMVDASKEEIKVATKRMAEINIAYQEIVKFKRKK